MAKKTESITTTCIILQTKSCGEFNRLITAISPQLGVFSAMAFGAEKLKSRYCSNLLPFTEITLYLKQDCITKFYTIFDIANPIIATNFKKNLRHIYLFSLFGYIITQTPMEFHEFKLYYYLLKYSIELIETHNSLEKSFLFFFIKLITFHGASFSFIQCGHCHIKKEQLYFSTKHNQMLCEEHAHSNSQTLPINDLQILEFYTNAKFIEIPNYNEKLTSFAQIKDFLSTIIQLIYHKQLQKLNDYINYM